MEEEEIDVVNYDPQPHEVEKIDTYFIYQCDECEYTGRTERGLAAHKRHKHGHQPVQETPKKARTRTKKLEDIQIQKPDAIFSDTPSNEQKSDVPQLPPPRVTTKQLLGGRRRTKTTVDTLEESAIKTDREASRLHELGVISETMPVGEYVARSQVGAFVVDGHTIDEEGNQMVVGEEVEIVQEEQVEPVPRVVPYVHKKYTPRQGGPGRREKVYPSVDKLPLRLTQGDPSGKYKCYIEDCHWRCSYRSLRMEHMKAVHPDWKQPPRFLLERISKDGIYLNPDDYVPPVACNVEGCSWRGNYRASRSSHMRKFHPLELAESKKRLPGYNSNGPYACHYPMCTWRGHSRSTRSQHLRKVHPDWQPDQANRQALLLTCFHCKASFPSYPLLLNHIEQHGGIGLHVDEFFETKDAFSAWLQRVERLYSIQFERTDPVVQQNDMVQYTLQCSCSGSRGVQLATETRSYIYQKHNFLKRRLHQFITRNKCDCSVHLEVREDANYERISVKGSLEHTGHRFGTPLLRMAPMDRQLYADILNWKLESSNKVMALEMVEKLNIYEGFTMDNYASKDSELINPLDDDWLVSLKAIIDQSEASCFFGVDFSQMEERKVSFGYMANDMKETWSKHGPEKAVTIDVCLVDFEDYEMQQYTVLVADDNYIPKCVAIYLTSNPDTAPEILLEHLKSVDNRAPLQILTDPSQIWVELIDKLWPQEVTAMISEWTIMDYWAAKTEQLINNEFDVFSIVAALRRMLRCDEVNQLLFMAVELFEALYECGYEHLAEFFDTQFSDVEYFKRWSPVHRNSFTSHAHPTLSVASRTLRDLYLSSEDIDRPDLWFVHATKRILEFNQVEITQTYTLRALDAPKKFYYNSVEVQDYHQKHVVEQDSETMLVYEEEVPIEELVEGDVVEEEVIGHDLGELDDHVIYEAQHIEMEQKPSTSSMLPGPSTSEQKIPPHRMRMYRKEMEESRTTMTAKRPRILAPKKDEAPEPPRRQSVRKDTTKSVIRGRKRKQDRFAELRDCPPEIMRAIAAHAIAYDGRKKEQRPFMFAPSQAQLAQSTTPSISTAEIYRQMDAQRRYGGHQMIQKRKQQQSQLQQQHQQWGRARPQALQTGVQERLMEEVDEEIDDEDEDESQAPGPSSQHHQIIHHHQMLVDHDEIVDDEVIMEEVDDQQPCTSSSLYRH